MGNYNIKSLKGFVEVFKFMEKDILILFNYVEDLILIIFFLFLLVFVYYSGKVCLGECMLWIVEIIWLGYYVLFGCKMVRVNVENYEGIYFLIDEELFDVVV